MSDPEGVEEREGSRFLQTSYPYGIIRKERSFTASTTDTDKITNAISKEIIFVPSFKLLNISISPFKFSWKFES